MADTKCNDSTLRRNRRARGRWLTAVILVLTSLWPLTGTGHIVVEEPWHPVPAAYLRVLFYLSLEPVDWHRVATELAVVEDPNYALESVYQGLAPAAALAEQDHEATIRAAIDARDAQAVYASTTTAVSQLARAYLATAASRLEHPGAGLEPVLMAQRIYRAFGQEFLAQADPEAHARLGIAWLSMASSVGSSGVLKVGGMPPKPKAFAAARNTIEDYLIDNYEVEAFATRRCFEPIPESVVRADPSFRADRWLPPGTNLNDQVPLPRLVLTFETQGIDERDLFLVAYGDMLFDSPRIFGEPAASLNFSCATCHNRSEVNRDFFIPGISSRPGNVDVDGHFFNPLFNDRTDDPLDIPSLRGIRFTAPYGRDGRFASLRDFTRNVIVGEFAGDEPTPLMLDAMIAYLLQFDWLPAPYLEPDGSLVDSAPVAAKRGELLFNTSFPGLGDRACSTCHVPSSNFLDGRPHDIGTGAYATGGAPGARNSFFDTPTLIGIVQTAPYFHDGAVSTLGGVVDWFDEHFDLGLAEPQRADLTAYLEAVGTGEDPYEVFDDEHTVFQLFWEELSTFISTLDTLIEAEDAFHAVLLIRTVANDLRLDASALQDLAQAPLVYELASRLDEIDAAIEGGDWQAAAKLWQSYKALEAEHGPQLR